MKQRGKKSSSSLAVVNLLPGQRYNPPDDLTEEQAKIWREIISSKPADYFPPDNHPLLKSYCRHVATANLLSAQINAVKPELLTDKPSIAAFALLLKMRSVETGIIISLASSMRLTQNSIYRADKAVTTAGTAETGKPWQDAV